MVPPVPFYPVLWFRGCTGTLQYTAQHLLHLRFHLQPDWGETTPETLPGVWRPDSRCCSRTCPATLPLT